MAYCQFCGARLVQPGEAPETNRGISGAPPPVAPVAAQPNLYAPTPSPAATAALYTEAPPRARLVVIAQDGTPGRHYALSAEGADIGRVEGSILLPSDPYISPRHARLSWKNNRFFLQDLGSLNGVYVRIREQRRLENADLVLVGLEVLRFEIVSDAEKVLAPAADHGTHFFGSPAFPRYARLCQRTVEGATRDTFYLSRPETIIGRESGDIVFTSDPYMSRRHAALTRDDRDKSFVLRDLGSSNGTYLAIRGEEELHHQDHMRIGQHLFRLEIDSNGRS
jgi:pSer/pThr/pTyr-binding forkhead associated (FHA) protein